jgi:predicted dinucleotide-binding enzyme
MRLHLLPWSCWCPRIRDVCFKPLDTGPLRVARYLEPFSLAVAQLAYEGNEGPEIAYRIERF